jgi:putative flippase GtrA
MKTIIDGVDISKAAASRSGSSSFGNVRLQIGRFGVIGILSVLVDFVFYTLLCYVLPAGAAKAVSYVTGMLVGFAGNKFWTFESKLDSVNEPFKYSCLYLLTFLINISVNDITLQTLGVSQKLSAFLVATGVTTVANFLGMRYWVFSRRKRS